MASVHQPQCLKCSCVIIYVQQDRDKLTAITMCHPSTYQFLRPCLPVIDCLAAVRQAVCNPHGYTSGICTRSLTLQHSRRYCLRTRTTDTITAFDILQQQWQPPTCLIPSDSSTRLVAQHLLQLPQASISMYSVRTTA